MTQIHRGSTTLVRKRNGARLSAFAVSGAHTAAACRRSTVYIHSMHCLKRTVRYHTLLRHPRDRLSPARQVDGPGKTGADFSGGDAVSGPVRHAVDLDLAIDHPARLPAGATSRCRPRRSKRSSSREQARSTGALALLHGLRTAPCVDAAAMRQ